MLKVKTSENNSKQKIEAMKALEKNDDLVGFHAIIPRESRYKLKVSIEKLKNKRIDISRDAWLVEKIEELYNSCTSNKS